MIRSPFFVTGGMLCALILAPIAAALASDHADTAANYNRPGADLADVFIFPSTSSAANVVLVMDVHPLIPPSMVGSVSFDPNVLYQFRIDNTGDNIEDLVIQARFTGTGASQKVSISGPYKPNTVGTSSVFARPYSTTAAINNTFNPTSNMTVFTGVRSDPFFFDLEQFFAIFPDRQTPARGYQFDYPNIGAADTPQQTSFRGFPAGSGFNSSAPNDLLASYNVLSIIVELPRSLLTTSTNSVIHLWETTSVLNTANFTFTQQDRLARPAVNEALATVSQSRHDSNNRATPVSVNGSIGDPDTSKGIASDILFFMNNIAGRRSDISSTLASVLTPDVMIADLSQTGPATYLGVETKGATGGLFGGRALTNDVIDTDLGAIFGATIPALGLVLTDDGKESPGFVTDHIGAHGDYLGAFPYLGLPHQ